MKLPLDEITIGDRQRIEIGDLSDLDSMGDPTIGLILPVVVHRLADKWELVDGRRRIEKARQLGWTEIECSTKPGLSPITKQCMELLADIGRKDRTWQEKCMSVAKIHELKQLEKHPDGESWTYRHMASFTGFGLGSIGQMLRVAEGIKTDPELMKTATSYVDAYRLLLIKQERAANAELERRRQKQLATEFQEEPEALSEEEQAEPQAPEVGGKIIVKIRGQNCKLADATLPDSAFPTIILVEKTSVEDWPKIHKALAPHGLVIDWDDYPVPSEVGLFRAVPSLVWNFHEPLEGFCRHVPFQPTYKIASVWTKEDDLVDYSLYPPSCMDALYARGLPFSIVKWCLTHAIQDSLVLCYGVNPVFVATCGMTPIFVEPDPGMFESWVTGLTAFYKENIPGVEVVL